VKARLPFFAAALWWGSLTAVGCWVVPLLFVKLPAPALAGNMAAQLFTAQTWVAAGCALVMLMASRDADTQEGSPGLAPWAQSVLVFVVGGVLLALLSEFAVAPRIVARDNLKLWHSVGSAMFVLQWVASGVVLWRLAKR
jgi:hypothetical protein